jgi:RNA polymerase sigma-70 factor (ECF subfamily)
MLDDHQLLQAWADGNEAAGSELVGRHIDALHRFFGARVSFDDAADLAQRTFLACLESRERLPSICSFRAFLLGIARHVYLKHQRKEGRRRRMLDRCDAAPEPTRTLVSRIGLREEQRLLLRALDRLPFDLQLALELHYWENLSTAEIGDVLGIPRGTVLSRLHRARELLRDEILALAPEPELSERTLSGLERWARSLREQLDEH